VDLLFLEFAVNDEGNTSPDNRRLRAMEGIIRLAKHHNPQIDIIMLYFADTDKLGKFRKGETPSVITDHESIAQHYDIPRLNLASEVTRRLDAGQFTWSEFSRDTCHPTERGHAVYAECIQQMLDVAWKRDRARLKPTPMPDALDPMNYERGRFIALDQANLVKDWRRIPAWDTEKKCNYGGAVDVLAAETPGAVLELAFEGTLIGISAIAGMDAGAMDVTIDDGKPSRMDMFDSYCPQFHRPVCHILAEDLPAGKHTLRLTIAPEAKPESTGHAVRVLKFVAN
jgi:sialidase-1